MSAVAPATMPTVAPATAPAVVPTVVPAVSSLPASIASRPRYDRYNKTPGRTAAETPTGSAHRGNARRGFHGFSRTTWIPTEPHRTHGADQTAPAYKSTRARPADCYQFRGRTFQGPSLPFPHEHIADGGTAEENMKVLQRMSREKLFNSRKVKTSSGEITAIVTRSDEHLHVAAYFTGEQLITARVGDQMSPAQVWLVYGTEILASLGVTPATYCETFGQNLQLLNDLLDLIWKRVKFATNFKTTWVIGTMQFLLDMMTPVDTVRVLDPCSGWGDRMTGIGALASSSNFRVIYQGYDPNDMLQPGYAGLFNMLPENMTANIKPVPFENCDEPDDSFHIVFTSPPYGNKEIYTDQPGQSDQQPDWDAWFCNVLSIMYSKAMPGGLIALHMCDTRGNPMTMTAKHQLAGLGAEFITTIGLQGRTLWPLFIWRK